MTRNQKNVNYGMKYLKAVNMETKAKDAKDAKMIIILIKQIKINGYTLRNKYHRCSNIDGCVFQESDNKCIECNSVKCLDVKTGLCENNTNRAEKRYYKCKKTNENGNACAECLEGYNLDEEGFCIQKK